MSGKWYERKITQDEEKKHKLTKKTGNEKKKTRNEREKKTQNQKKKLEKIVSYKTAQLN